VFKRDKKAIDEAEGKAKMLLCDILIGLGNVPRDRMPEIARDLEYALAEAKTNRNGSVVVHGGVTNEAHQGTSGPFRYSKQQLG
jgi:hypothetical protein